jgi:hypothetical protein
MFRQFVKKIIMGSAIIHLRKTQSSWEDATLEGRLLWPLDQALPFKEVGLADGPCGNPVWRFLEQCFILL